MAKKGKSKEQASTAETIRKGASVRLLWSCLALGLLILICYSNSFTAGLLFDSEILVRMDPRVRSADFSNIQQILTRNYWWPSQESLVYRPLTTFSYLVNYTLLAHGDNPVGYHVVNFLLHWANAWLVFLIVRRLAGQLDIAAVSAALFAVHPVNTEAVTNVVGRADLLAALSVLFGGWCYLRALDAGARKVGWLVLMGVSACLGVLAKENAVMIVAFVAIYDLLWRWPTSLKTAVREFAPGYAALLPALLLIAFIRQWIAASAMVFDEFFLDNPIVGATPFQGFMTAMGVIGRYLKLLAFPQVLSADYSFNQIPLFGTGSVMGDIFAWASLVAVVLLIALAFYLRRHRLLSWGILLFFLIMLPTSNVLMKIGSIMADRFMYLPSIGFCVVAAIALHGVSERIKVGRWILPLVVIVALGARTFVRNADWHDELSLWASTVAASPRSFKAQMLYGNAILVDVEQKNNRPREEALDEAIVHEEIAQSIIETQPPLPLKWQNAAVYLHLAKDYRLKGQLEKSLEALATAQALDAEVNNRSREFRLRRGIPAEQIAETGNYLIYESLCLTYAKLLQWDKCEEAAHRLQAIAPEQAAGYQVLGAAYFGAGRNGEAAVQFMGGWLLHPKRQDWIANLNATYKRAGAPQGPFTPSGLLDTQSPIVRQHLNEAAVMVVRLFQAAKQWDRARELQERFIREHGVPVELFG